MRAPLEYASLAGNHELVEKKLLLAGADGSAGWRGNDGRTLLDAAADSKVGMGTWCRHYLEQELRPT